MFKNIRFGSNSTKKTRLSDGSMLLNLEETLENFPEKITEKLLPLIVETAQVLRAVI